MNLDCDTICSDGCSLLLYESKETEAPKYADSEGVRQIGTIKWTARHDEVGPCLLGPKGKYHRVDLQFHYYLGQTELRVVAKKDGRVCGETQIVVS